MKKMPPIILMLITEKAREKFLSLMKEKDPQDCSNIIYIDTTTINQLDKWKSENQKYFYVSQPIEQHLISIDVSKIDDKIFPTWLVKNQNHISYGLTSDYIECVHLITDPEAIDIIKHIPLHSTLMLKDIKKQIQDLKADFNTEKYEKYVSFYDNNGQIAVTLIPFHPKKNCFSFPLLRRIAKGLNENSIFEFRVADATSGALVFTVESDSNIRSYFNFSHIPPFL